MLAARGLTVLIAVIVAGWFGLSTRQAHNINAAEAILTNVNSPTRAQARHAGALLSSAATLNPDREIDLLRGALAQIEGNRGQAVRILLGVTHSEPMNLDAWYQLANVTTDPHTLKLALEQIAALAPDAKRKR